MHFDCVRARAIFAMDDIHFHSSATGWCSKCLLRKCNESTLSLHLMCNSLRFQTITNFKGKFPFKNPFQLRIFIELWKWDFCVKWKSILGCMHNRAVQLTQSFVSVGICIRNFHFVVQECPLTRLYPSSTTGSFKVMKIPAKSNANQNLIFNLSIISCSSFQKVLFKKGKTNPLTKYCKQYLIWTEQAIQRKTANHATWIRNRVQSNFSFCYFQF